MTTKSGSDARKIYGYIFGSLKSFSYICTDESNDTQFKRHLKRLKKVTTGIDCDNGKDYKLLAEDNCDDYRSLVLLS